MYNCSLFFPLHLDKVRLFCPSVCSAGSNAAIIPCHPNPATAAAHTMANLVITQLSITVFVGGGWGGWWWGVRRHHIKLSPADVRCVPAAPVGGIRKGIQMGGLCH